MQIDKLKYPVGKFRPAQQFTQIERNGCIKVIGEFPTQLRALIADFTADTWNRVYREDGWNGAQVVNHLADSHMNAFVRIKLGLTEDNPTIKPYAESLWASTADGRLSPPVDSLNLIEGLHARWVVLLESLSMADYERTVYRPDSDKQVKLSFFLALYAWHCRHHLGHLQIISTIKLNAI